MRSASIVLIAALAACRAPRGPGSGALVFADSDSRDQIQEIIARVEPKVITALGTSWPWRYDVEVDPDFTRWAGDTRAFDRRVRLGPRALSSREQLELTLTHELVHVHMTGAWEELPIVAQEGIAYWVAVVVLGLHGPAWKEEVPPPRLVRHVLVLDYDEYKEMSEDERYFVNYAAMYLASTLVEFERRSKPFVLRMPPTAAPHETEVPARSPAGASSSSGDLAPSPPAPRARDRVSSEEW